MMQAHDQETTPVAWTAAADYTLDAWQRGILFLDVLRQRGNQYFEHMAMRAPNVLHFDARSGARRPQAAAAGQLCPGRDHPAARRRDRCQETPVRRGRPARRARAGHRRLQGRQRDRRRDGGRASLLFRGLPARAGAGQTIEDIMLTQAAFLERVIELHPEADGRPVVIGNCQGGWAMMLAAATRPELFGPLIIAGAPLSYWAGVHGKNPMRYSGGLNGGSWLTALAGDLGAGIFDGAALVQNFENMNPSNTLWSKQYNLFAKVDSEGPRYLEFEKWWGGHVLLNAEEMQWIVDNLFVGNKLATAEIVTRTACASTCATSPRRSSASAPRVTTSRRRSRRWAGSWTCTAASTTSAPTARPSSTASTKRSAIWASSSPAAWRRRSTRSSPATSTSSIACRPGCTRPC